MKIICNRILKFIYKVCIRIENQVLRFDCDPIHLASVIEQLMSYATISPSAIVLLEIPLGL